MSEIIELIKVLRERTGAGLMDCKKALLENGSDIEASISWLREKGIAKVAKKSGRIAAEGLTTVLVKDDRALVLEINSETDFVAHSEPFNELVQKTSEAVLRCEPGCVDCARQAVNSDGKTLEEAFTDATIKLGEKLELRRFEVVKKTPEEHFGSYIHMKGKISVLVKIKGGDAELSRGLAMTVAATNPSYLTMEDVPSEALAKELEVQLELAAQDSSFAKKPEAIQEKIISGRVNSILGEQVLAVQEYILDPTKTVSQALKESGAALVQFIRYQVGEGLEKRQDDFASEVMNQAK